MGEENFERQMRFILEQQAKFAENLATHEELRATLEMQNDERWAKHEKQHAERWAKIEELLATLEKASCGAMGKE